jgi:thioredoxin-dependent peroxiredoxin
MALRIDDIIPDFAADTTDGPIRFHDWIGDGWVILFSHPRDFTPVCTTEFADVSRMNEELTRRGARAIGLSVDPVEDHLRWKADIETLSRRPLGFPIIADPDLRIARLLDMLPGDAHLSEPRRACDTLTVRRSFVIAPDRRIRLSTSYPNEVGRNFFEIMRVMDALRLHERTGFEAPSCWAPGDRAIVPASMDAETARARCGAVDEVFPYLRLAAPPA